MTPAGATVGAAPPAPAPPAPRWVLADPPSAERVARLEEALSLPTPLCATLVVRGYQDVAAATAFLRPELSELHPPALLSDAERAATRILEAIDGRERIFVHGDYDVDGIAGAALLATVLRALGGDVVPFVPHRLRDGYDFGATGVRRARDAGAGLIVTVDCGIQALSAVASAGALGMDVIVTDHHQPGPALPDAVAVVNPNRKDCAYPNGGLSGTGVAFKLCQLLAERRRIEPEWLLPHLDLVALASVADMVPLTGENRVLVRYGLRALERTERTGLRALLRRADLADRRLDAGQVGFRVAPPLNAAGRVQDAQMGLDLLLLEDPEAADAAAGRLVEVNRERQQEDRRTLAEAWELLAASFDPSRDRGVVVVGEGWHPGVIGIVASRLVERVHRPVIVVALDGESGRGSGRSIPGFDLLAAIRTAGACLDRFGGHRQAAGLDVRRERVEEFREAFNRAATASLSDELLRPRLRIDLELPLDRVTRDLARFLWYAGPFGMGNARPIFMDRACMPVEPPRLVGRDHLRLRLRKGEREFDAIGFGLARRIPPDALGTGPLDIAYQIRQDWYRGRGDAEIRLLDVRATGEAI